MTDTSPPVESVLERLQLRVATHPNSNAVAVPMADVRALVALLTGEPLPLDTAPRDGTIIDLLVDYSGIDHDRHALANADRAWTIGFNNFDDDGEDRWQLAGYCWDREEFAEGKGEVIGWRPRPENCPTPTPTVQSTEGLTPSEREGLAALHEFQHNHTCFVAPKPGASIIEWAAAEIAETRTRWSAAQVANQALHRDLNRLDRERSEAWARASQAEANLAASSPVQSRRRCKPVCSGWPSCCANPPRWGEEPLSYGSATLEDNERVLAQLAETMSPEAFKLAQHDVDDMTQQSTEVQGLIEALRPFAAVAGSIGPGVADTWIIEGAWKGGVFEQVTAGDFRRALAAYERLSSVDAPPTEREKIVATDDRHAYSPHRKFPWFCGICGYAEHERLKHPPRGDHLTPTGSDPS